jgi:hypothetical protein
LFSTRDSIGLVELAWAGEGLSWVGRVKRVGGLHGTSGVYSGDSGGHAKDGREINLCWRSFYSWRRDGIMEGGLSKEEYIMDDDHINLEPYTSNNYVPLVRTL